MREIVELLVLIECEEEHLGYIGTIIEAGCTARGYSYESIPVNDGGDFGAYYKVVKE
jgi:hypothetical protein